MAGNGFFSSHGNSIWRGITVNPSPVPERTSSRFTSPIWSNESDVNSFSSHSTTTSFNDLIAEFGDQSPRALKLRYDEISQRLKECREQEHDLEDARCRLIEALLMMHKNTGQSTLEPIAPPRPGLLDSREEETKFAGDASPPSREVLLSRLVDGSAQDYRRIFVPNRGWVSRSKLQSELNISDAELKELANQA